MGKEQLIPDDLQQIVGEIFDAIAELDIYLAEHENINTPEIRRALSKELKESAEILDEIRHNRKQGEAAMLHLVKTPDAEA